MPNCFNDDVAKEFVGLDEDLFEIDRLQLAEPIPNPVGNKLPPTAIVQ